MSLETDTEVQTLLAKLPPEFAGKYRDMLSASDANGRDQAKQALRAIVEQVEAHGGPMVQGDQP